MANFTFTLEKYHGTKSRHTCPNCSARREFSRYIDATGTYLADDVGKCNRESRCGYHKKPKEHFAEHPRIPVQGFKRKMPSQRITEPKILENKPDYIFLDVLKKTLSNYGQNSFVQFLSDLFRDDINAVRDVLQKYYIGTWKDGLTVFWQIDTRVKIRTGKLMRFDMRTGKRQIVRSWTKDGEMHELKAYWMHKELITQKTLHANFNLKQCFFGEHLLTKEPNLPIAIVEAEKTAIICAICFPEMLWLAVGAKGYLTDEKFKIFASRKVLLFPDADAYTFWQEKAIRAQRNGFDVSISSLIETQSTGGEKENGFDLADYLIAEQSRINQYNSIVDNYNKKLDKVLIDKSLIRDFETILDEQKAILMIDGDLSETQAESYITKAENVRSCVLEV